MAVRPFRWQGKSRIEQLQKIVLARSLDWLKQWSGGSLALDVAALTDINAESGGKLVDRWYRMNSGSGILFARTTDRTVAQIGCRLAGLATPDSHGLAAGVGLRALTHLVRLLAESGEELAILDAPPPAETFKPCHGVLGLTWLLEGARIEIYLDADLCDVLLPRQTGSPKPLVHRRHAILPGQMTLTAMLDLNATIQDIQGIQPGQVLKTGIPLFTPIDMRSSGGAVLFSGSLVALDGRRALRC